MPHILRTDDNVETAGANQALSYRLGQALQSFFEDFGPTAMHRTCGSCSHMEKGGPAFCKRYNMTPPVNVIMTGCDSFDDEDKIPF